ncbi:unnamed protein product [Coffea canephora]|uniref:Uncharacterized protein n=1 Tax=Coffea canephora TaxID=49390 RepID=A0A068TTR1_COFCA|nr:unnamed protein product [Coffea canephora]
MQNNEKLARNEIVEGKEDKRNTKTLKREQQQEEEEEKSKCGQKPRSRRGPWRTNNSSEKKKKEGRKTCPTCRSCNSSLRERERERRAEGVLGRTRVR